MRTKHCESTFSSSGKHQVAKLVALINCCTKRYTKGRCYLSCFGMSELEQICQNLLFQELQSVAQNENSEMIYVKRRLFNMIQLGASLDQEYMRSIMG